MTVFTARTVLLVVALAAPAGAQSFQKIVDSTHAVPGLNVTFEDFDAPVLDGLALAFRAQSFSSLAGTGIFRADTSGTFAAIATRLTQSPAGGTFSDFGQSDDMPSIDAGTVAFVGLSSGGKGVFRGSGGALDTIATDGTDFPDTDVVPFRFYAPSLDRRVAVTMTNSPATPYFSGVYSYDSTQLFTVVDTNPATFGYFNIGNATTAAGLPNEGVYVYDVNQSPTGPYLIYRRSYQGAALGTPELIVASNTLRPDGLTPFVYPARSQADRGDPEQLCFMDGVGLQNGGVFRATATTIETVADTDTPIPDGTGHFTDFGLWCSIYAGDVAFVGRGVGGQQGVYVGRAQGVLEKVVDTGDTLGGATPVIFDLSREALSGGRLAFKAFAGPESALWITPAPEPSALAAGVVALLACAVLSRRRQYVIDASHAPRGSA
jgi:hypothetical protein